jgi:DNA-directed RNA polymerase omega subunit
VISATLAVHMPQNPELQDEPETEPASAEPTPVITSRFLFVDVAAQRAKQLRRGALPRLGRPAGSATPHKLERIAMEEVREGLIKYTLPVTFEGAGRPERAE